MRNQSKKYRSFVALDIPEQIQASLLDVVGDLRKDPHLAALRWIPQFNWHLTLMFLGDQTEQSLISLWQRLIDKIQKQPPVTMDICCISGFPDAKSSILAAQLKPLPALVDLQAQIRRCCELQGVILDIQRFRPHITLARGGKRQSVRFSGQNLKIFGQSSRVVLYTSELTPQGSVYTAFRETSLQV